MLFARKAGSNMSPRPSQLRALSALLLSPLLALAVACSAISEDADPSLKSRMDSLGVVNGLVTNGLVTNGLVTNGLVTNGLVTNGLVTNGLVTNGLAAPEFLGWFDADRDFSNMVMHYVVSCALPTGRSLSWSHPVTGVSYSWDGNLGLTPGWSGGAPASEEEQQLITACLAVHVNKYGVHDLVSVQGKNAAGVALPFSAAEETQFTEKEACFFGNLFRNEGVYAANDRNRLTKAESTSRGCGLSSQNHGLSYECDPMVHVGSCTQLCKLDPTGSYYVSCKYNGKTYKPLTTRLRPTDVFNCGDGVCQFTESCGKTKRSHTYDSCALDCGVCPSAAAGAQSDSADDADDAEE